MIWAALSVFQAAAGSLPVAVRRRAARRGRAVAAARVQRVPDPDRVSGGTVYAAGGRTLSVLGAGAQTSGAVAAVVDVFPAGH